MIPQISRGGGNHRGGARGGVYQANRGQSAIGRGRGGGPPQQRGGMNPAAQQFSPQGQKRTRDEGSMGGPGNGPKRARGGGQ